MRQLDEASLRRAALAYLVRYASSRKGLTIVLERRAQRWRRLNGGTAEGDAALIEAVVAACAQLGLVDDARFAAARTETLRARGWPERRIRMALRAKGVEAPAIDATLADAPVDEGEAAERFAERRRLGPWRVPHRPERRDKDIAAMVRAGFSLSVARATIDRDPQDRACS